LIFPTANGDWWKPAGKPMEKRALENRPEPCKGLTLTALKFQVDNKVNLSGTADILPVSFMRRVFYILNRLEDYYGKAYKKVKQYH
jgi:hypothetical protein